MRLKREGKLFVEPPSLATGDIAFNLIVFFLVCASVQPDSGREQAIPRSEKQQQQQQSQNLEVNITAKSVQFNGLPVPMADVPSRLRRELAGKTRPEDKVVVVRSSKDTPYDHWIRVTGWIEDAGGTITLQLEEEEVTVLPGS